MATPSIEANPLISQWIDISATGVVRARTGKSELGQGIATALAQIVADALGVDVSRVQMQAPGTGSGPDEGFTAGSLSVQHSGSALDAAGRAARNLFEVEACRAMGVDEVRLDDGWFIAGERRTSYWELASSVGLDVAFDAGAGGNVGSRAIGTSLPRRDLVDKVLGAPRFLHDLRLPGMLFGRVLRPPYRGAQLGSLEPGAVAALPGVEAVVVDGSFVGVVADTEIHAREALEAARVNATWTGAAPGVTTADVRTFLTEAAAESTPLATRDEDASLADTVGQARLSARYSRPFLAHGSIGPSVAAALHDDAGLRVWTHTQGVYPLRKDIARALDVPVDAVSVEHVEGAGCYGHNGADDVAYDAALLAFAVPGRPVHVTWSREDELGWAPFGPAMVVDIESTCDGDGTITSWTWNGFGNGHSSRPSTLRTPSLLAFASQSAGHAIPPSNDPPMTAGQGTGRNAIPGYEVGAVTAVAHRLTEMPIRASALRSLGAHLNVFAIEQHMDDLAQHAGADPLEYRLRHLVDPRGRAVLERVAEMCDWPTRPTGDAAGRGLGFARYKGTGAWCAVVVDVEAEERIRMQRMWIAVDVGRVVNPDGVVNQIEGGAIQSASWTLLEQVRFADGRVVSDTWEEYPILTFNDVPPIEVSLLDRPDQPWLGAGEASMGPTAAALGNALMDATGIRVRALPLTPESIIAAMELQA